jgi:putative glutathione S-transferase
MSPDTRSTAQFLAETSTDGAFVRQRYRFRDRITADGLSGYKAKPGRYHLDVSLACPGHIGRSSCAVSSGSRTRSRCRSSIPFVTRRDGPFARGAGHTDDPVCGFAYLSEAYLRSDRHSRAA